MDRDSLEAFRRWLALQRIAHTLSIVTGLFGVVARHKEAKARDPTEIFLRQHERELELARLPLDDLEASLRGYFNAESEDARRVTEFYRVFGKVWDEAEEHLTRVPRGVEKGQVAIAQWFQFHPLLPYAEHVSRHTELAREAGVNVSREALQAAALDETNYSGTFDKFFGLRLMEQMSPLRFEVEISKLREEFKGLAREAADDAVGTDPAVHDLPLQAESTWLLALSLRSPSVVTTVFSPMRQLVHQLVRFQSHDGCWMYDGRNPDPSVFLTVNIAHGLAVFGDNRDEQNRSSVQSSIRWLLRQRQQDGGWPIRLSKPDSDVLATALVVEFLRRVDEESYCAACEAGEQFILGQQVSFGLWHFDDRKSDALNILVMDVLEKLLPPIPQQERLLELSRELFFKAEELVRSGEHVDGQIAVMVAHHAVEMFHYGLFSSMDPAEVFVKSDGKTIGVREALGILQRRLQADAKLAANAGLPFRNDIQLLANARDAIVHQGQTVTGGNTTYHLRQARRFLEQLSGLVLGGNLLA